MRKGWSKAVVVIDNESEVGVATCGWDKGASPGWIVSGQRYMDAVDNVLTKENGRYPVDISYMQMRGCNGEGRGMRIHAKDTDRRSLVPENLNRNKHCLDHFVTNKK